MSNHVVTVYCTVYCPLCGQPVDVPFQIETVQVIGRTLSVTLSRGWGRHQCPKTPQDQP